MHKKRFTSSILVITLIVLLICGCSKGKDEKEEFASEPLIIEEISGVQSDIYMGRIIIKDENIKDTQYEGAMYISIQDGRAIIVATDYIRNEYEKMCIGVNSDDK